ncbi:hypothetical protein N825_37490 [Skermanella stibiiresistens SB22]|uniref:histidine kinase n=1 Tax=Skermanella stibiiresistens SB22 TaxID=1385369 RepID=W9GPA8_9PROT|nr:HAMP domain-containing sensor histidine kinase [Skermanella stibiiresistens]EWY35700.1 hypothetical protein N825_37490 [Skermanella stibiiresistens SB22]
MSLGKVVWTLCFLLVLGSSPMLLHDLVAIERSVRVTHGNGIWYDGRLATALLRLQLAIHSVVPDAASGAIPATARNEMGLLLRDVLDQVDAPPGTGGSEWRPLVADREAGMVEVRRALWGIDQVSRLLDVDPAAFRRIADARVEEAIVAHRRVSHAVMDRQNALVGVMQGGVDAFRLELLCYGVGFTVLLLSLGWLMRSHMLSEAGFRTSNRRLMDLRDDLTVARDTAMRAGETKSILLSNVSHELRTPLNAILGFSEALSSGIFGPLPVRQAEYVGDIHHAGQRLLALVNDVLDLAKLQAGKLELWEEVFDLKELAAEVLRDAEEAARAAGVTIGMEPGTGVVGVLGDRSRLRQALEKPLSNAIKFTPGGGRIGVSVGRLPDGRTRVTVTDTGIGVPAEDLGRVFLAFEQSDSQRARRGQGTGLGLPLARQLVERHGGVITMSSEPGVGTAVVVELPPSRAMPMGVGVDPPPARNLASSR